MIFERNDPVFREWYDQRPEAVKRAIDFRPPGTYRLPTSPVWYTLIGYDEAHDGTVTARLHTDGPFGLNPRQVFGVSLDELIPAVIVVDAQ